MTIASEIERIQWAKASIKTAIENKGVVVPSTAKLDSFATYINSIDTAAELKSMFKSVTPTSTIWSLSMVQWDILLTSVPNKITLTYDDSNYRVFMYVCEWSDYNNSCNQTDHYVNVMSYTWIVDKTNNYSVTKVQGARKAIYIWRSSDWDFWWWDGFWNGTAYLYYKDNQLKLQLYKDYASCNYTYSFCMTAYWLYDLTIDLSTKSITNSEIYHAKTKSSYKEGWIDLPSEYLYENLSYKPDSTWTLLGNPSWNNMNKWFAWWSVAPSISWTRGDWASCYWSWTLSLVFTA